MDDCIYRWDLDKTYLRTEFDTLRDLFRTAFQSAEEKESVPGAPSLLRELQRGSHGDAGSSHKHLIYFISGAPRQMRRVLEEKLRLDKVSWDELVLKPNLWNLFHGRFRALREQVGYKLPVLLAGRIGVPGGAPEVLFGDDAESDAFVYSLYADLVSGRVGEEVLNNVLDLARVYPDARARAHRALRNVTRAEAVKRIFIHLDRKTPPGRFIPYGRRVVPIFNYFQAVLVLYGDDVLPVDSVLRVGMDMMRENGYSVERLANSLQDLLRRGMVDRHALIRLDREISRMRSDPYRDILKEFRESVKGIKRPPVGKKDEKLHDVDYPALFQKQQAGSSLIKKSLRPSFLDRG